jgi:hypothetical protein
MYQSNSLSFSGRMEEWNLIFFRKLKLLIYTEKVINSKLPLPTSRQLRNHKLQLR